MVHNYEEKHKANLVKQKLIEEAQAYIPDVSPIILQENIDTHE
jgi:hypothetical protein